MLQALVYVVSRPPRVFDANAVSKPTTAVLSCVIALRQRRRLFLFLGGGRSDDLNLGEVFQAMSKKEHTRVWTSVLKAVAPIVDEGRFFRSQHQQGQQGDEVRCRKVESWLVTSPPTKPRELLLCVIAYIAAGAPPLHV